MSSLCYSDTGLGREENEDLAWPGFLSTSMRGYQSSPETDYPVIRKEDFENHNKDGGFWVVMRGKVSSCCYYNFFFLSS